MIKKKTFSVSNDGVQSAVDQKSLQCRVNLLDGEELVQDFSRKVPGQMVLDWVASSLGILEREYFGLLYLSDKAHMQWLDPVKTLKKQITKSCCRFSFLVKFYAVDPATLQGATRHLFILQLKRDIAAGTLVLPQDSCSQILAFILQAELGDLNPLLQRENYISHFHLIPNQTSELEHEMEENHEKLRGMSRNEAVLKFLLRVKWLDGYGLRLYAAKGVRNSIVQLGISPPGVSLYQKGAKVVTYLWSQVTRVSYKGKKFMLTVVKDEGKPHLLSFELDSFGKTKNMWKITIDMLNFYRSEAESVTIGREVDSLVDVLDTQGSPHPVFNRRLTGEFRGRRGSPRRSSLPLSVRHAISASPASLDSSPQPLRFADLLDSTEHNERGIEVSFPPTPPSSRNEHENSHLHTLTELSSNVENVSPDIGSEHYQKFPTLQAALYPASALRSSGRRRFKSHLLQVADDGDSRDLENGELRTYKNYVLATGSPVGMGRSGGFYDNNTPLTTRSKSTSPTYVNLQYHLEGRNERRLYAVEERAACSSDEDAKEAPFQPSGLSSSRARCYSAMGMSHDPKPKHSLEVWADEAPVRVRQTRHDFPPSSPTVTPNGKTLARGKAATLNQVSLVSASSSQVYEQDAQARQISTDGKAPHSSVTEDITSYRPRSSSLQAADQKHYGRASTHRAFRGSKDNLNDYELEDGLSLQSSSKSSMRGQESLRKLAQTLGYLSTETAPSMLPAVETKEPPAVFKRSPSKNTQEWGTSKSHLYENLPDEDVVAAITAISDVDATDDTMSHLRHASSTSGSKTTPPPINHRMNGCGTIHAGDKKLHGSPIPKNGDSTDSQLAQVGGANFSSSGITVSRTPSNVTLNHVISPPPEFAGDLDSGGEETTEDQGRDFTVDWTPRLRRQHDSLMQSKSEESISVASNTLERQIFRVKQTGKVAVTSSAVGPATASVEGRGKWDRCDVDSSSCSEARVGGVRPCTRESSNVSISKMPGYISVSPTEEPQHAERLFISNPYEVSEIEVPLGSRRSADLPAALRSETQLTSSASSSPGSKTSQCILAASSPKLKLLSDPNQGTQPLSKLAKLVDQMQQNSHKPQFLRNAVSTRKEPDAGNVARRKLQMPNDSGVEERLSNISLTGKVTGRREADEVHGSTKENGSPKEDPTYATAASRGSEWQGVQAPYPQPLPSEQQDPQDKAVGERRYSKKRAARNTSEQSPSVAEQERGGVHHLDSNPAHPVGYVSQRQAQSMALSPASVMAQPSPVPPQLHSAEYYNDMIHPYAVSRRYYPDELSRMPPPPPSPSSMSVGYQQHVTHHMSPSPVNPQFVEEAMFSRSMAFSPNLRNSYQYHSFQTYSSNPFFHPSRVVSPVTPPPVYLHPPNYYQGSTHREEMHMSNSVRNQSNGHVECFDKAAAGTGLQSGQRQLPWQQKRHTAGAHSGFQRPPSRADVPRGFVSPDHMPVHHTLMHDQEHFALSQPVDGPAYQYQQYAFQPNFRHSFGANSMNTVKAAANYQYAAPSWPTKSSSQQHLTYSRYQRGNASQRRRTPSPCAHTPIVLTTPAASNSARRSKENLLDDRTGGITYSLL